MKKGKQKIKENERIRRKMKEKQVMEGGKDEGGLRENRKCGKRERGGGEGRR